MPAVASPFPRAFICETARFRRLRVRPCFRFQPSAIRSLVVRSIPSPRHRLVGSWFGLVPVGHMTAGLPSFPFSVVPVRSLRAWVSLRLPARAVRWPFPCEKSVGLASARSPCEHGFRRRFVIASSFPCRSLVIPLSFPRRSLVRRSASGRLPARSLSDSALVASSLSLPLSLVRFFAPFSAFLLSAGFFPSVSLSSEIGGKTRAYAVCSPALREVRRRSLGRWLVVRHCPAVGEGGFRPIACPSVIALSASLASRLASVLRALSALSASVPRACPLASRLVPVRLSASVLFPPISLSSPFPCFPSPFVVSSVFALGFRFEPSVARPWFVVACGHCLAVATFDSAFSRRRASPCERPFLRSLPRRFHAVI